MITQIRRHLKSTGFKTALWIFIIALAGGGVFIQLFLNLFEQSQWALKVDGATISSLQFERQVFVQNEYIKMLKEYFAQQGLPASLIDKDAQSMAKDQLVHETLLDQVLRRYPIDISPEYFVKKVSDPYFVRSYLPAVAPLANQLKRFHITESDFEKLIDAGIKRYIFVDQLLTPSTYVPEFVKAYEFQSRYALSIVSYVALPFNKYVTQEKSHPIADEALKEFFEEEVQKGNYHIPEKRSGTVWRFDARRFGLSIPEKRIKEYYKRNMSSFVKDRARITVRRIVLPIQETSQENSVRAHAELLHAQLLKDPSQFELIAQEHSQDKKSAVQGGLIAPFSRGDMGDSAFEKAAFLLKNDGAISSVVRTSKGFELIQRVAREPQVYKTFTEVKDEIRDILLQKKFEQRFVGDVSVLLRNDNKNTWKDFIKSKVPNVQVLESVQLTDTTPGTQILYKLKEGSFKAYLDGQVGVVVRLNKIVPRQVQSLSDSKKQVSQDLRMARAESRLALAMAEMVSSGMTLEEIAKRHKLEVVTLKLDPQDNSAITRYKTSGIPIDAMKKLRSKGTIVTTWADTDGYLIRLDETKPINQEQLHNFDKDSALYNDIYGELKASVQRGFIASLYRDATIKVNHSLL